MLRGSKVVTERPDFGNPACTSPTQLRRGARNSGGLSGALIFRPDCAPSRFETTTGGAS